MKPPTGFIRLHDAIYMIGIGMFGSDWCPKSDLSESYTVTDKGRVPIGQPFNSETERVVTMIAEACADGEIAAAYWTIVDAVDLNRNVWRRRHCQHYFAGGMIELDLPLIDGNLRPNTAGHTTRGTREIYLKRDDLDRFIKALPTLQKSKAGAPAKHDWESWRQIVERELATRGDPRDPDQVSEWNSITAAANTLLDLYGKKDAPDVKTLARHISKWLPRHHGT